MKKLRIAQVASPFLSVPPPSFGGTEAVISSITEELVRRGHAVSLFASGDSKTSAKLISPFPKAITYEQLDSMLSPLAQNLKWMNSLPAFYHVGAVFKRQNEFDIIHDHTQYLSCFFSTPTTPPMISTYHGSFSLAMESPIEKLVLERYKENNWTAISENQKKEATIPLHFVGVVHHGVQIEDFPFTEQSDEYLVWLGRITERKGTKEAIMVAKRLQKKLIICGNVKERDQEYFRKEIEPEIDNKLIFYRGTVSYREKIGLLENAKALLYPVKWEEPFGMVLIEAMGCGTPVIGFDQGAVSEIVRDNSTGYVIDRDRGVSGLIIAGKKLYALSDKEYRQMRRNSRKRVEQEFTVQKMVDHYERIYRNLLV